LGSIRPFPRKGAHTIADVWRVATVAVGGAARVRPARLEDYAAVRAVERAALPGMTPLTLRQFEARRLAFPEGQWIAESDGAIAGAGSSMVVRWDDHAVAHTWSGITGDGTFITHDPQGRTLFGCDLVADTTRHGYGVARALQQARRRLCRRLNLRRVAAAVRMPRYGAVREAMPPDLYAKRVIWGELEEPLLAFHLVQGFQYCGILHGYQPEDTESGGHAALLVWLNPLYTPPEPGAFACSERPRKCA
jgi:GNAT superfamily N-acetyltransferase